MITNLCRKAFLTASFFILTVIAGGDSEAAGGKITIQGDPCSAPLAKKLGDAFSKKSGVDVVVTLGKCRSGVTKAMDGDVNIGVSTYNFEDHNFPKGLVKNVVAQAPIVLVVHVSNPINNLTSDQVNAIFKGQITNWKQVGGWDTPIRNVMLPPCVTETMSHQAVSYGFKLNKLIPETKGDPVAGTNNLVSRNEAAIGMQLYGYESSNVKVLKINGVLPTAETVPSKYSYFENYNILTKGNPTGDVKKFIEFARSTKGKEIALSLKHIPSI